MELLPGRRRHESPSAHRFDSMGDSIIRDSATVVPFV